MNMKTGYPNDLRFSEHGSMVKVISKDGSVRYEKPTYWGDRKGKRYMRKARKAAR